MSISNICSRICYRSGYKYQLQESYCMILTTIQPASDIVTDYIQLDKSGQLTISKGYAWDGPSGPMIATKSLMRGSLVHDALYQLMRGQYLDHGTWREAADRTLYYLCLKDGVNAFRALYVYWGVRLFGQPFANPSADKQALKAP
jgi:hypothetical protein